jgi:PAS domain S-box-containing protein
MSRQRIIIAVVAAMAVVATLFWLSHAGAATREVGVVTYPYPLLVSINAPEEPGTVPLPSIWKILAGSAGLVLLFAYWIRRLSVEVARRRQVEAQLRQAKEELELRVEERTAELEARNVALAEEALKESEAFRKRVFDSSRVPMIVMDGATFRYIDCNPAAVEIYRFASIEETIGRTPLEVSAAIQYDGTPSLEKARFYVKKALAEGMVVFEWRHQRPDGEIWDAEVHLMSFQAGDRLFIQFTLQDVTERKRAIEALRTSEQKYRSVIENIQDVFYRSDAQGRLLMGSPSGARLFGYDSVDEMIGLPLDLFWPDPAERQQLLAQIKETGSAKDFEAVLTKKDGTTFNALFTTHFYYDDHGNLLGTEGIIRDITERKRAEEEMSRLRNYLEDIINSMPSVLVGVDGDGKVTQWNAAAERVTGIRAKEAQGWPLEQALPMLSHEMDKVRQAIRDRVVTSESKAPRMVDGERHYEDVTVYPLAGDGVEGAVIRVDDVTERVRIEEMMVQSEKMLSVGRLAAGMAHEINNPLGAILQASQNIVRRFSPDLPANARVAEGCGTTLTVVRQYLDERQILTFLEDIRNGGLRAAQIVENMLSFSRKPDAEGISANLAELLERTLLLAESDYDSKKRYDFRQIEIVREYHPDVPLVVCQASKIQQVFLNILRNGAEAMGEVRDSSRSPRFMLRVLPEGSRVRVEIEDNGPGMDEATRRRLFEPFFTTKPPGMGTGLGMSVSYFIVTEDHGGTLSVESSPGVGTRFFIRLPVGGKE